MRRVLLNALASTAIAACALVPSVSSAATPEEFYKGRTMRMLIPAAVGDSYDTEGRLIAQRLTLAESRADRNLAASCFCAQAAEPACCAAGA